MTGDGLSRAGGAAPAALPLPPGLSCAALRALSGAGRALSPHPPVGANCGAVTSAGGFLSRTAAGEASRARQPPMRSPAALPERAPLPGPGRARFFRPPPLGAPRPRQRLSGRGSASGATSGVMRAVKVAGGCVESGK